MRLEYANYKVLQKEEGSVYVIFKKSQKRKQRTKLWKEKSE